MDYLEAATYWEKKNACAVRMERNSLLKEIEKFIAAHNTCALATGCRGLIRCTPIEYNYYSEKFWILSDGGLKFRALEENPNVCLAIFDSYAGFDKLGGLQVTGTAALAELWSDEYMDALEHKKISAQALKKLAHPLYLIRITPVRFDFLYSDFKLSGYDARQHIEL